MESTKVKGLELRRGIGKKILSPQINAHLVSQRVNFFKFDQIYIKIY